MHIRAVHGRSAFFVLINLPAGREATLAYLETLGAFPNALMTQPADRNAKFLAKNLPRFNPELPQFPVGTQVALVRELLAIQTEIRDAVAARAACERLHLPEPAHGTFRLFSGEATGLGINLPGWRFPAVCDLQSGQVAYDHFNGRWGNPQRLADFLQAYAAEKVKIESRRQGHSVTEQALEDGFIKLTVHVGDQT